jgi:hypothetical protein
MKFIHKILCHYGKHKTKVFYNKNNAPQVCYKYVKQRISNNQDFQFRKCTRCGQVQRLDKTQAWVNVIIWPRWPMSNTAKH